MSSPDEPEDVRAVAARHGSPDPDAVAEMAALLPGDGTAGQRASEVMRKFPALAGPAPGPGDGGARPAEFIADPEQRARFESSRFATWLFRNH